MAEKAAVLGIEWDYKTYLYYVDGSGSVCRRRKDGTGDPEVIKIAAVERDRNYLYFVDKDGDVSRSARGRKVKEPAPAPEQPATPVTP